MNLSHSCTSTTWDTTKEVCNLPCLMMCVGRCVCMHVCVYVYLCSLCGTGPSVLTREVVLPISVCDWDSRCSEFRCPL